MKSLLSFVFISLLAPLYCLGQLPLYTLAGAPIKGYRLSINKAADQFYGVKVGQHGGYDLLQDSPYESKLTGIDEIIYERLSGRPLFIYANKIPVKSKIGPIAARYQSAYQHSITFFNDLQHAVADTSLTRAFVERTLGEPASVTGNQWSYPDLKLDLTFTDSVLTKFISRDYANTVQLKKGTNKTRVYITPLVNHKFLLVKRSNSNETTYFLDLFGDEETEESSYNSLYVSFTDGSTTSMLVDRVVGNWVRGLPGTVDAKELATKTIKSARLGRYHISIAPEDADCLNGYMKALLLKP